MNADTKKSVTKSESKTKAVPKKTSAPKNTEAKNINVHVQDRLLQVILAPQITEKATHIADNYQQIAFKVRTDATKPEIKAAVELVFKVEVEGVTVANVGGKTKRAGRRMGKRNDWKKAYVSLKPGQEINFAAGE
jgi:large subunit ribosomal protein L23